MPGISCSAISISLRPYTCAEILRTQKSELPWLFVCDVFSLGEAFTQILSKRESRLPFPNWKISSMLPHLRHCLIQCKSLSWSYPGRRQRRYDSYIQKRKFHGSLSSSLHLFCLLTCTSSSLLQPSWLGQGTQSGRCWRPWWSSSSPPWCSPPPASPPPSDGWKWEERWIYERLPAFAWKHCSTHKGSAWEEWLVGYGQVWTWDWLRKALKKKIRDYLEFFPNVGPPPLLGILTVFYRIILVKLEIFGWF